MQKSHILTILRQLAYFRPKKVHRGSKVAEAYGDYNHNQKVGDDPVSVRHQELIQKANDKHISVPHHVGRFVF